jgi:hypothetical protein
MRHVSYLREGELLLQLLLLRHGRRLDRLFQQRGRLVRRRRREPVVLHPDAPRGQRREREAAGWSCRVGESGSWVLRSKRSGVLSSGLKEECESSALFRHPSQAGPSARPVQSSVRATGSVTW